MLPGFFILTFDFLHLTCVSSSWRLVAGARFIPFFTPPHFSHCRFSCRHRPLLSPDNFYFTNPSCTRLAFRRSFWREIHEAVVKYHSKNASEEFCFPCQSTFDVYTPSLSPRTVANLPFSASTLVEYYPPDLPDTQQGNCLPFLHEIDLVYPDA